MGKFIDIFLILIAYLLGLGSGFIYGSTNVITEPAYESNVISTEVIKEGESTLTIEELENNGFRVKISIPVSGKNK